LNLPKEHLANHGNVIRSTGERAENNDRIKCSYKFEADQN
jgi:hypothetical protein